MKTILISILMTASSLAHGAQIQNAWLDLQNKTISMDVVYSGGCEQAPLKIDIAHCSRTSPSTCVVQVSDKKDACRALIQEELIFPVQSLLKEHSIENVRQLIIMDEQQEAPLVLDLSAITI